MQSTDEKKRILYLDIAKGFAILFMFAQHCILVHEVDAGEGDNILAGLFCLLGTAPAAPVFMVIMGVFVMASKAPVKQIIYRGIRLIALGYLLNILRFPLFIAIANNEDAASIVRETLLNMFTTVDILQLAGLSVITGALIKNAMSRKIVPACMMMTIILVSPFLWGRLEGNFPASILWGTDEWIAFPFFPWVVYPLLGMYLKPYLLDGIEHKKMRRRINFIGLGCLLFGIVTFDLFPLGDYSRSGAAVHGLIIGFVLLWLNTCHWMARKFQANNRIFNLLSFWSRQITVMYVVQWILFAWSVFIFGANQQNAYVAAIIGMAVLLLSHTITKSQRVRKLFVWI